MQFFPTFKGHIVDYAKRQVRKIPSEKGIPSSYISFDSSQGKKMHKEFIALYKFALRKLNK
jgi:hypothetical protein